VEKNAKHHREREEHYGKKLEEAEKELREKGITLESVVDTAGNISYNVISSGSFGAGVQSTSDGQLQARIDPKLLNEVKRMKNKTIEHKDKAVKFEKYLRAFKAASTTMVIELSVDEVTEFRLGD